MSDHSAEDISKHVRVYMMVFASLAVLTVVTVAVSYIELPTAYAIAVALVVASVKGSLVGLYFMHLISERNTIYWLLLLTVVFFVVLMYMPATWYTTGVTVKPVWDHIPVSESHGGGHGHDDHHGDEAGGAHH